MMAEVILNAAQAANQSGFYVAAPYLGDIVTGALHCAYDDQRNLPDAFRVLLEALDRID